MENMERYCELLGDRLLVAAVEHAITKGLTLDPDPLLCEWELEMRIPIEKHVTGNRPLEQDTLEDIFTAMRKMHDKLDK